MVPHGFMKIHWNLTIRNTEGWYCQILANKFRVTPLKTNILNSCIMFNTKPFLSSNCPYLGAKRDITTKYYVNLNYRTCQSIMISYLV